MTPEPFFPDDTYTTPPGRESALHRLMFRSRLYYMLGFLKVVLGYRQAALRGEFNSVTWSHAAMDVFRVMEACGGRFNITGLDYPREVDGPIVLVANHMSTMETLILPTMVYPHKNAIFVVKQQLREVPLFGIYVQDCIAVNRQSPMEDFKQVMAQGADMIAKGYSVIIFPQATRSTVFDPEKFNTLGVKLARRTQVPVVPVALKTDFWGTGKLVKDFGPVDIAQPIHLEFGPPIEITGSGKEEHEQIVTFIRERIVRWGGASL